MTEEKKHRRQYAVLSRQTIKHFAEASCHGSDMPEEIAAVLAEDVSYRIRELVQISCQHTRNAKRRKLAVEDFNKGLKQSDCQPVCGHGSPDSVHYRQIREVDVTIVEDHEIGLANLACADQPSPVIPERSVRGWWLTVEGLQKALPGTSGQTSAVTNKPRALSEELQAHYEMLTKAILSCDPDLIQGALTDLKTNTGIVPLLRNLVNFITNGIRKLNHDPARLLHLLYAVDSLLHNKIVFLECQPYMSVLVDCVRHCAVEPLSHSAKTNFFDQWMVRDYAARLLAYMIKGWDSPVNKLHQQVTQGLSKMLADPAKPFCSHYGAVAILTAIGVNSFEKCVLPHVSTLWPHLQTAMEDVTSSSARLKSDAVKVCGILQTGLLLLIRAKRKNIIAQLQADLEASSSGNKSSTSSKPDDDPSSLRILETYRHCYNPCGDTLAARLPVEGLERMYAPRPLIEVSLADENSNKTGEELLQQFLPAMRRGRGRRSYEMGDFDISRYDGEDVDVDDDERSSERSHSDENLSFLGEDVADLTVKTTVSDPSKGIKLTIAKKPKSRTSEAESQDSGSEHMKTPPRSGEGRRRGAMRPSHADFFEATKIRATNIQFVFSYAGRIQRCKSVERRKSSVIDCPPVTGVNYVESDYHRLSKSLPIKRPAKSLTKKAKTKCFRQRVAPYCLENTIL